MRGQLPWQPRRGAEMCGACVEGAPPYSCQPGDRDGVCPATVCTEEEELAACPSSEFHGCGSCCPVLSLSLVITAVVEGLRGRAQDRAAHSRSPAGTCPFVGAWASARETPSPRGFQGPAASEGPSTWTPSPSGLPGVCQSPSLASTPDASRPGPRWLQPPPPARPGAREATGRRQCP